MDGICCSNAHWLLYPTHTDVSIRQEKSGWMPVAVIGISMNRYKQFRTSWLPNTASQSKLLYLLMIDDSAERNTKMKSMQNSETSNDIQSVVTLAVRMMALWNVWKKGKMELVNKSNLQRDSCLISSKEAVESGSRSSFWWNTATKNAEVRDQILYKRPRLGQIHPLLTRRKLRKGFETQDCQPILLLIKKIRQFIERSCSSTRECRRNQLYPSWSSETKVL